MNGPTTVLEVQFGNLSIGHQLTTHEGKCHHLHGHDYIVVGRFEGPIQDGTLRRSETGMVVDFAVLKSIYKQEIHSALDHAFLLGTSVPEWYSSMIRARMEGYDWTDNELISKITAEVDELIGKVCHLPIAETTAELISNWMVAQFERGFRLRGIKGVKVVSIAVYETPSSCAIAYGSEPVDV